MYKKKQIIRNKLNKLFNSLKIRKNDNIFLHSNIAGVLQHDNITKNQACGVLYNFLKDKIGTKGTLIIPTYSYAFIKKNLFDLKKTKSETGYFSNYLINKYYKNRTYDPIFSHLVFGKVDKYKKKEIETEAFGKNSIFKKILKNKFKILCFCCSTNNITFLHYIEKKAQTNYRYHKYFKGKVIINNKKYDINYKYFVRKKSPNLTIKENKIYSLIENNKFNATDFGRFKCYSVESDFLYKKIYNKILKNDFYLVKNN